MKMKGKSSMDFGKTDTDVGTIHWDDVEKLMQMDEEYNRINRGNQFGAWEYDPETKTQQYVPKSAGMQAATDRMDRRIAGEGFNNPDVAGITNALTQTRLNKMGGQPQQYQPMPPQEGQPMPPQGGAPMPPQGGQLPQPPRDPYEPYRSGSGRGNQGQPPMRPY